MKISTTIFLACLLTALSVYYFVAEKPSQNLGSELASIQVLTLAEGDFVSWLRIQNQETKETMALAREKSNWRLEYPVFYPAENFLVQGMVNSLTFAQRVRRFPLKGKAPRELGFDSPKIKIEVETPKTTRRQTLLVGADSPVGGGVYARWEGEEEYFLILPEVRAALERTVYSIRQKKLFRVNWENVNWIEARERKKGYRLEKEGKGWRGSISPGGREIFLEKVDDLIYAFQSLYVKEFMDGRNPAKTEFGLKEANVSLAAGKKGRASEKLVLGSSVKAKDGLYALRERENLVLVVSEMKIKSLLRMFEANFLETGNGAREQAETGSGKDSEMLPAGREKPG